MRPMSASRSSYERDLPGDLLELIDHTTRGVQRLYESTRRAQNFGDVDETARSGATADAADRTPLSSSFAHETGTFAQNERPLRRGKAGGDDEPHSRHHNNHHHNNHHHNNHHHNNQRDDTRKSGGARRWPWSRVQPLPAGGMSDERSVVSTANMTFSSDASRCPPAVTAQRHHKQQQQLVVGDHQVSMRSTVNSSTTGLNDNSSLQPNQGWKDTFKSLLSAAVEPATTAITTAARRSGVSSAAKSVKCEELVMDVQQIHQTPLEPEEVTPQPDVYSATLAKNNAVIEDLRRQLEKQEISHREELSQLRLGHNRELAQLRREILEAQKKTEEEVTTQLQASFGVKQKLLQAAVENERVQAAEAHKIAEGKNKMIDQLRVELESAATHSQSLEEKINAKGKQVTELRAILAKTREQVASLEEEFSKRTGELAESRKREKLISEREQAALDLVRRLELKLQEQDQQSREELRRLEAEFHSTTESYQKLIGEATVKLSSLEKIEKKYRTLKEQRRQQKQQQEEWTSKLTLLQEEKQQLTQRTETLEKEVEDLRLHIARKEHEVREERAAHHQIVEDITKRMEEQKDRASRDSETLQKTVQRAEDTTTRLQREAEGLTRQLEEEQKHSKELLVKLEQSALRHREELAGARRSASAHQQQSDGVIAALKRQLREKDAKLEALATTASEPVQRLRSQLEDERSKRAKLEEQFNQYKHQAKVAREAALREVRREQQRGPFVGRSQSRITTTTAATNCRTPSKSLSREPGEDFSAAPSVPLRTPDSIAAVREYAPKGTAAPCSHECNRSREGNDTQPSRSVTARGGWDSVGSISNISCGSLLCSSRSDVAECVQNGFVDAERRSNVTREPMLTSPSSPLPDNLDDRIAQHERLLHEFHESAADVFRKITGNRDEFLAKCTSLVRSVSHNAADGEGAFVYATREGLLN